MDIEDVAVKPSIPEPVHLGDGVYASYDGFHINLAVNHHNNHVVSLDPSVMRNLFEYARRLSGQ
jgi:hypothetical protein